MVVDDHFVVRIGLNDSINAEPDMEVVAQASNGLQGVEFYRKHKPDVALIDLRLPQLGGIETTAAICTEFHDARVIMLSTYDGDEDIYRALQVGARSYLLKTVQRDELLETIRRVHAGERYLPPEVAARLAARVGRSELTAREKEVLQWIVRGRSNKEIASALSVAEVTVKLHVSSILSKLQVADRTQAATTALERGIVHLR